MDAFVEPLLARGRRVVAPDLVAHGESAGETASLFDLGDSASAIVETLGRMEGAIAHSAGCVALAEAVGNGAPIGRAALIAPPLDYGEFVRNVADRLNVDADALAGAFADRDIDVSKMNMTLTASRLDTPALFVHSRDDGVTSYADTETIAKAWRGSRLLQTDGLGHRRILRDPATVEAVVRFIAAA